MVGLRLQKKIYTP